jgi:hypothetical protein
LKKGITVIAALAVVLAITSGAFAAKHYLITSSSQIKSGAIHVTDLSDHARKVLEGNTGPAGAKGHKGDKGDSGLTGAFYATAYYNVGDTNAGAIATVACDPVQTDYVAIAGGVQVLGLVEGANSRNTPVSSSLPGRMHWDSDGPGPDTDTPKENRLDGWIVQFGGNAGATSDKHPEKVKVWALCVPGADIPVNQTYQQVD